MAKYINKEDVDYIDLNKVAAFSENTKSNSALTIIGTSQGDRTRLSAEMYKDIGSPESVWIGFAKSRLIIRKSLDGEADGVNGVSNGRIIYNTKLANKIKSLSKAEFKKNTSTGIGKYKLMKSEDGVVCAVINLD